MNWLEVSLTVNGELAEAVADVLARFAPNGVVAEQGVAFRDEADEGTGAGPITVRAYVPADERLEGTRRRIEESLHYLGMIQPLPAPAFNLIADQNWMEAWKQNYKPIPIGRRLVVVPAWLEWTESGRIPIKINPGMAFGTGTHPTTQLCLEMIENVFDDWAAQARDPGRHIRMTFIDVGCGSGILSIAALKLGAASALAVDTDSQAIENARENADTNGIGPELSVGVGSVKEILEGMFAVRTAELVAANILAPVIIRLLDAGLADLVAPGGALILSGILQHQADSVIDAAQAGGLRIKGSRRLEDWIALAVGN
jgi:ribosomal protein L11 methyltransferase